MASPSTPAGEMLLVSPRTPQSQSRLSSSKKRQVTPSEEATSAKKIAVVARPDVTLPSNSVHRSAFGNPLGWPAMAMHAQIDTKLPLPNPLLAGAPQQIEPFARHINLPFDLRTNRNALEDPDNRAILASIFPENIGISTDGMFVYFHQKTLPPKPWPITVAGLPSYISTEMGPEHSPIPDLRPAYRKGGSIAPDQNGRDMRDWDPLFNAIKDHFELLEIPITEVMYWGNFVIIVLEHRDTDFTKLPWKAANILCFYLYDDEMGRPQVSQARRQTDPTPGNPDNSKYNTLQPGLRITSAYLPSQPDAFLSTTAGVLVKDQVGNEFMTAASHGFPEECGTQIMHPGPDGRNLGEVIMEVTHTDIALVKLANTESFSNITFQTENIPNPVQLKQLRKVNDFRIGDSVVLDSPDTGCLDGILKLSSYQRIPSDDPGLPYQQWIFATWFYMGQESAAALSDGMCGTAIWTEEGDVLGFFRWAPKNGAMQDWCAGIAADELIKRGFTLVDTST